MLLAPNETAHNEKDPSAEKELERVCRRLLCFLSKRENDTTPQVFSSTAVSCDVSLSSLSLIEDLLATDAQTCYVTLALASTVATIPYSSALIYLATVVPGTSRHTEHPLSHLTTIATIAKVW